IRIPTAITVPNIKHMPRHMHCPRLHDFTCAQMDIGVRPEAGQATASGQTVPGLTLDAVRMFASRPMSILDLGTYIIMQTRSQRRLEPISASMPFNLKSHLHAQSHSAQTILSRLQEDVTWYAQHT